MKIKMNLIFKPSLMRIPLSAQKISNFDVSSSMITMLRKLCDITPIIYGSAKIKPSNTRHFKHFPGIENVPLLSVFSCKSSKIIPLYLLSHFPPFPLQLAQRRYVFNLL